MARGRTTRSLSPARRKKKLPLETSYWINGHEFTDIVVTALLVGVFFGGLCYVELIVCTQRENVPAMVDHPFNWALPYNKWLRDQEAATPGADAITDKVVKSGWGGRSTIVTVLLATDTGFLALIGGFAIWCVLSADDLTVIAAMLLNHGLRGEPAFCIT